MVTSRELTSTYSNKRVFVTGHTGFKGSWLCEWLLMLGADVKGYALPPESDNSHFKILSLEGRMKSVFADIRDKSRLEVEINDFQPDFIFHLAAQPLVRRSYRIPSETFEVNAIGTANLLECIKGLTKKCIVVVVTTDKVYENVEQDILYKETDTLGGYDPYSASKACAELVINSFRNSFFHIDKLSEHQKILVSARAGNVIGGGDFNEDRLIPDMIRAVKSKVPLRLRNPDSIRPWQHVLEPLLGYLIWGSSLSKLDGNDYAPALNFGPLPNDHLTVREVAEKAIEIFGTGSWEKDQKFEGLHEAGILKLDVSKAISTIGWKPVWNSTQAIEHTMKWYLQPQQKMADFSREQIKAYMNEF